MTDDWSEATAELWARAAHPLRRDARAAAPAGLPAATPIAHAPQEGAVVHRGLLIAGFAFIAVIGLAATTVGILTSGVGAGVTADASANRHGTTSLLAERGVPSLADDEPEESADSGDAGAPGDPSAATDPDAPADGAGNAPVDAGGAPPASGPGSSVPGPGASDPGPADPGPANPGPTNPGPTTPTNPVPSDPTPPAPAPPAAPKPLAFTGIAPNYALNILGIKLLASYTLSLSGQPGAKAAVTYGDLPAGSVTFDSGGRASLVVGASLLGLSNPMIGASYSDGTAGAAIQARRDSI
ncbi:hypothetical protein ACUOFU_13620 [Microbacterium arabinogalactanolyticum]|uniref:hypothetical protein n=1 Tax=Microbacterium arabinogalactanolyticum TaxID=69365 RepID=UPI0040441241